MSSLVALVSFAFALVAMAWGMQSQREATKAKASAILDPLTGLFNRRGWETIVDRESARSVREGTPMTVFVMDIDDFKLVNDKQGHAAGDDVLIAVAHAIRSVGRKHDVVARFGGDEFALLAVDDGRGVPDTLVHRLTAACAPIGVTISIGYAAIQAGSDVRLALQAADRLMYTNKMVRHARPATGRPHIAVAQVPQS